MFAGPFFTNALWVKQERKSIEADPKTESQLSGKRFGEFAALRKTDFLNYDETWYQAIFHRWVECHQKCVRENGHFFCVKNYEVLCAPDIDTMIGRL